MKKTIKKYVYPVIKQLKLNGLNPVNVFKNLQNASSSGKYYFFENSLKGESDYSYIGIDPSETLRIKNGITILEKNNETFVSSVSPVESIESFISDFEVKSTENLPHFFGGITGFISYDFISFIENISLPTINSFNESEAMLMLFKDNIIFDFSNNSVLVVSNIISTGKITNEEYNQAIKRVDELIKVITASAAEENYSEIPETEPEIKTSFGQENFCKAVKKIKEHIKNGDIFQCVLSEKFEFEINVPPLAVYEALREINPSPYLFFLATGEEILLGSSPEMFVRVKDNKVQMCPIAGTRPRGTDHETDLRFEKSLKRSVKEKAEHLMLVDLGRNDIGRVSAAGSVKLTEFMKVEKFSSVMHLVSLVEGNIKPEYSAFDVFKSCFPAGTLSGAPKIRAMQIISATEPVRRGAYGGAVFCYGFGGYLDSCITIRSLFVKNGKGYIQAGAGIVADSRPEREYEEILNKSKAVFRAVKLAESRFQANNTDGSLVIS